MSDLRHSLLIEQQLPEYIREEYPKFISFIRAYYEFLDSDVLGNSKKIRNISDVDYSLEEFERNFFNTYLSLLPRNVVVRKDIFIKNIKDLYSSKGSKKSYELFFKLLFNETVEIELPRNNILRASDGRWIAENSLRVVDDFYSEYVYDGITNVFYLPFRMSLEDFEIYIDNQLTRFFLFREEYDRIEINIDSNNLNLGSKIKIKYLNFDPHPLSNKKVKGLKSSSTAIIEFSNIRRLGGAAYYEMVINNKTLFGNFINGESIEIYFKRDNGIIKVVSECFSDLQSINIINGGKSYNVGDIVLIKGTSNKDALAVVSQVTSGVIDKLEILDGGAGYKLNYEINETSSQNTVFKAIIDSVDAAGTRSSNTISYNTDIIANHQSVLINAANYSFPASNVPIENVNTVIASALSMSSMNGFGSITSLDIETSLITSEIVRQFKVVPPEISYGLKLVDLHKIGRIKINNPGLSYQIGENLIFTNIPPYFSGRGANAFVSSIHANGGIKTVTIRDGGFSYSSEKFPVITINTQLGTGANLEVDLLMSTGEQLINETSNIPYGIIQNITLVDSGKGYLTEPLVDLSTKGDGTALANAILRNCYIPIGGRWETSDGLLSDDNTRIQGDDYYIDFSYVLSSKVEFAKYKQILKNLLHPAGLISYAKYTVEQNVRVVDIDTQGYLNIKTGPTVNIRSNSVVVLGNNTQFLILQNAGTLLVGSYISVNSEIRIVNAITSNTSLNVSESFTFSSNNMKLNILNVSYEAILTENYRELMTQNNVIITTEKNYT